MVSQAQLVKACQRGDHNAFPRLVERYQKPIYNYVYQMTGSYHDAQDITQETFLRVHTSISMFEGKGSLSGWIYRIAANLCIDRARRHRRRPTCSLDAPVRENDAVWQLADGSPTPDVVAENVGLRQLIARSLRQLQPEHRAVVILHDVRGLTYTEISGIVNCPVGTVKSRLSRARAKLRDILVAEGVVDYWKGTMELALAI